MTHIKLILTFLFFIFLSMDVYTQVTQEWAARYDNWWRYDCANSIAVDNSGNVYVTGRGDYSETNFEFVTIKYNSAGARLWYKRYGSFNWGNAIAVDGLGNSYVAGHEAIIKYNSGGGQQWINSFDGDDIVMDEQGYIYATGSNYITVKFNSDGDTLWVRRYSGPRTERGLSYSIAVDNYGNVYVTGQHGYDIATVKYNSLGVQQWASIYNGPEHGWDLAKSITVDNSGNVYVTGESFGGSSRIYATIKYNSNGDTLWVRRYNGPGSSDRGNAIVVDDSGNVYVTGSSTEDRGIIIKYNALGVQQWVNTDNGSGIDMAMDDFRNLYVAGYKEGKFTTTKYNTYGVRQWIMIYVGPYNGAGEANSIALDSLGNVYVTGMNYGGTYTNYDFATIKYSQYPLPIPSTPLLVSPANNATLVATNPLLDWDSSAYAESYKIQVSADSLFTSTVYDSSGISISEFQIPNNGLNINTTYYWRVNAKNVTGTSPWSTIFHFTTGATNISGNNEIPKEFRLNNSYPNPFNPSTKIKFDIPKTSDVKLIVYNILGKEIATLVNEKLSTGSYEVDWDGSGYPSGVYFYKLITEDFIDVKKMVLIK